MHNQNTHRAHQAPAIRRWMALHAKLHVHFKPGCACRPQSAACWVTGLQGCRGPLCAPQGHIGAPGRMQERRTGWCNHRSGLGAAGAPRQCRSGHRDEATVDALLAANPPDRAVLALLPAQVAPGKQLALASDGAEASATNPERNSNAAAFGRLTSPRVTSDWLDTVLAGNTLAAAAEFLAKTASNARAVCASSSFFNSKIPCCTQMQCKPVRAKMPSREWLAVGATRTFPIAANRIFHGVHHAPWPPRCVGSAMV